MPGLQPAGRLRGVLVEGGADEASLRLGNVRWVLGLHPGRQTLSALAERGRRPLGPGQSLTGTRFPSSAAPPTQSATLALGRNVRAWLSQMTRIAHRANRQSDY